MIHLRALGPLDLTGDDGSEVRAILAQPKRFALLVFLAVGGKGGFCRRDHLLAEFWPERGAEQARGALNRAIYYLRQALGDGVLLSRGDEEVGLAWGRFWCDAAAFELAASGGDHRAAIDLYRGDLLEGFFVTDAPEFERWLEVERRRLRTVASQCAASLAESADEAGNRADAVHWARWAVDRSPIDEANIRRLVRFLDRAGDRAGAILVYEEFVRRLAAEFELSPSPETESLVVAIRGRTHTPLESFVWRADAIAPGGAVESAVENPEPRRREASAPRPAASRLSTRRARRTVTGAMAAGVLALSSVLVARRPSAIAFEDRGWVLIGDFENSTGDRSFDRTLDLALATALRQSTRINVVPRSDIAATLRRMRRPPADSQLTESLALEVARRDGIPVVVLGRIAALDRTYHLTLRAVDAKTGRERRARQATADGKGAVISTLDVLSARLRADLGESAGTITQGVPLPKATTESVEALEKYAAALRAMDAGIYPEAAVLLRSAIRLDSNFAMAHGALGQVFYGAQMRADGDRHFERALALGERLTERERLSLQIQAAGSRGNRAEAMKLLRAYLTEFPDDQRAWTQLGYEAFRSRSPREALAAYESAANIRPLRAADWTNVASAYATLGLNDSTLVAYARAFALDPALETWVYNNNQYGKSLVFAGRLDAAAVTFEKMLSRSAIDRVRGLRSLAHLDLYRGKYEVAIARMNEAASQAFDLHESIIEPRTRMMLAAALEESGRPEAAHRERMRVTVGFTDKNFPPRLLLFLGKPLARNGHVQLADQILDTLRARARPDNPEDLSDLAVLEGEAALAHGRRATAIDHLKRAFQLDSTKYALESLAYATAATGDLTTAAALYEKLASGNEFGWEPQQYWRFARFWLGVVHETRGDRRLAVETYRRFLEDWQGVDETLPVIRDAKRRIKRLARAE
jgi:DNA-binding SARP family transcriptional activator/Tfp pilus assembly protein PilF